MAVSEDISKRFLEILGEWGEEFVKVLVDELEAKGVVGGGGTASKLAGSIQLAAVSARGVSFTMADYWEYVEYGRRKGKRPPIDKIIEWIRWKRITPKLYDRLKEKAVKGLKGRERSKARDLAFDKAAKSLAFAIANKIAEKGTIKRFNYDGAKFIEEALKIKGRELEERLLDEIGIEITVGITDRFKR